MVSETYRMEENKCTTIQTRMICIILYIGQNIRNIRAQRETETGVEKITTRC